MMFLRNCVTLLGFRGCKILIIGLVAGAGIAGVELALALIIQLLLKSFGLFPNYKNLTSHYFNFSALSLPVYKVAMLLVIAAIIRFIVQLISTQTACFLQDYSNQRLRLSLIKTILFSSKAQARISSAINFQLSEVIVKAANFIFNTCAFLSMLVQNILLFLIMFLLAWKESICAFFSLFILGIGIYIINKKIAKFAKIVPIEQQKLTQGIEKIARNFIFIKLIKKINDEYHCLQNVITQCAAKSIRANFF